MSFRQILPLAVLVTAFLPASALAATATVTGDDGNPVALSTTAPISIRNIGRHDRGDGRHGRGAVLHEPGLRRGRHPGLEPRLVPHDALQPDGEELRRLSRQRDLHLRACAASRTSNCTGTANEEAFRYTVNAGTAVTAPTLRLLTRLPNSFPTRTHQIPVALNPGAVIYEVRYARGGVAGPDGAISGPSAETFVNRTTGLADFRFDKPGRWLIVARVKSGIFFTPWSAPVNVNAIAPFDLDGVTFPDARGPSYKLRGPRSVSRASSAASAGEDRLGSRALHGAQDRASSASYKGTAWWPVAASPSRCASAAACSSAGASGPCV